MSDHKNEPSRVGYANPPVETRFQTGQSGNPAGRPKRSKGVNPRIRDELNLCMKAIDGAQPIIITKKRAIVRVIILKALAGDARAAETILKHARANEAPEPQRGIAVQYAGDPVDEDEEEGFSNGEHQ